MPVNCGIYCRVSVVEAADPDQNSIEAQRTTCEHYVQVQRDKGWTVTAVYEDAGFSGKDMDRPGMRRLLDDVRSGRTDVVVSVACDRVSRSLRHMTGFLSVLEEAGATFVAATQSFDTSTSAGSLLLNVLMSFAEFERSICVERTQLRMRSRAQAGRWNGGMVPLGYDYDRERQLLTPSPTEADGIRAILDLAIEHGQVSVVRDEANARGYRTKIRRAAEATHPQLGGRPFTHDGIKGIVRNPIYAGLIRCGEELFPGVHEPLVTEETWRAANHAIDSAADGKRRIGSNGRDVHVHLLKGLVRCGHCGSTMTPFPSGKTGPSGERFLYYQCSEVVKHPQDCDCPVRRLPARKLEEAIARILMGLARDPDRLRQAAERSDADANREPESLERRRTKRSSDLQHLDARLRRLLDVFGGEGPVPEVLKDECLRRDAQRGELLLELERLDREVDGLRSRSVDLTGLRTSLVEFARAYPGLDLAGRKRLMGSLVTAMVVESCEGVNEKAPAEAGAWRGEIRTRTYRVNIWLAARPVGSGPVHPRRLVRDQRSAGSGGWTRTSNNLVNSQVLCH